MCVSMLKVRPRRIGCRWLLITVLVFTITSLCSVCRAAVFTNNTLSGAKFTERLNETVRFVHAGPVVGDFALLNERGTFTLQGTLSLAGIDLTAITPESTVTILLVSADRDEYSLTFELGSDPQYETGDTSSRFVETALFGGRTQVVTSASVKINPLTDTLRLKLTGKFLSATVAPDTPVEQAGRSAIADRLIGLPSQSFDEPILLILGFATTADVVVGSELLTVAGRVKTTPRTDPEIGTFNSSTVALAGLPRRTRN